MTAPIPPVSTPDIAGVTVRRHVLDHETARLIGVAQRLGKRLSYWLRTHPLHVLPDTDTLSTFALYARLVLGLLGEQRRRATGIPDNGAPSLSEAEHAIALAEFVAETERGMTTERLRELLAEREGR